MCALHTGVQISPPAHDLKREKMSQEKYPEGHFIGKWTAIGVALGAVFGIPLGIAIGDPAFFGTTLPVGIAVGVAIGSAKEKEAMKQGRIRPLTKEEKKRRDLMVYGGMATFILGMIVLLAFLLW